MNRCNIGITNNKNKQYFTVTMFMTDIQRLMLVSEVYNVTIFDIGYNKA